MTDTEILQKILDAYDLAEQRILTKLSQLATLGMDSDEQADTLYGKKLQQLRQLRQYTIQQLQDLAKLDELARESLTRQFLAGIQAADGLAGTSSAGLNNLVADYTKLLQDSRRMILRQTEDAYRRIVFESTVLAPLGIDTRIQTARKALDRFANEGITAFIAKDGKRWSIIEYTEMATRSTYANAQREGRISALENSGRDLIIINSVPNASPLCAPYERKVLSISGKSDVYPSLASAKANGLFHPNCRHSMTAFVAGLTKRTGNDTDTDDYEATQDLRYAERQTRKWKRRLAVADDDKSKAKASNKIKEWRSKAKDIAASNDLVFKPNRLSTKAAH